MPKPLSNDLRCRLVECVEEGSSRREAAARFKTAASSAVNVLKLWKETGSVEPRARGGYRHGKLKPHRAFILAIVERQHDITMPELAAELLAAKGVKIDPSNLSKFLIAQGLSFKKKLCGHPSKTGLNWPRRGPSGKTPASLSWARCGTGSSSSMKQARRQR